MYLISAEGYTNAGVCLLAIRKTGKIWISMKNVHDGLDVKNISDLILKEIYGRYETFQNLKLQNVQNSKLNQKQETYLPMKKFVKTLY